MLTDFHSDQVKENHERMQKERDLKRQQAQAKKEAEAQARLVVLKVIIHFHLFLPDFLPFRKNVNVH